ncbi:MAG: hypothetical protein H7Z40_03830 [Phycisphaerae bacterium]|nr:hypothetical protein [Gemmatimonadaceae bacterium]
MLESWARQDLRGRVEGDYAGDHARIKLAMNQTADALDTALGEVSGAVTQVSAAGSQIAAGSQSLAAGSSEQAGSLDRVSASLSALAVTTRQNAKDALEARGHAEETLTSVAAGVAGMNELTAAMHAIRDGANQTAKIVKSIDEIAFQTNLLALNAAVEAARAGDAGRSFAVVADEVRSLAIRAADAARTTATLIESSSASVAQRVLKNQELLATLEAIQLRAQGVSAVVGDIAASSAEQSTGIEQITSAIDEINAVTQSVAANAEESASAAEELSSQTMVMQSMVQAFQLQSSVVSKAHRRKPAPSAPRIRPSSTMQQQDALRQSMELDEIDSDLSLF